MVIPGNCFIPIRLRSQICAIGRGREGGVVAAPSHVERNYCHAAFIEFC